MLQELVEKFHSLEAENNLFDLKVKGRPFWQYMRYYLFEEISREKAQAVFPKSKKSYAAKLGELAYYFAYRLKRIFKKQQRFVLL